MEEGRTPTQLECIARAEWFEGMAAHAGSAVAGGVLRNRGREWRAIAALTSEAARAQRVSALSVWMKTPSPRECVARADRFERLADQSGSAVLRGVFRKRAEEWRGIAAVTSEAERAQRVIALDVLDAQRIGELHQRLIDALPPSRGFN